MTNVRPAEWPAEWPAESSLERAFGSPRSTGAAEEEHWPFQTESEANPKHISNLINVIVLSVLQHCIKRLLQEVTLELEPLKFVCESL